MKLLVSTALIGAALVVSAPPVHANEDPAANPPNCSAADLEAVRAGVQTVTGAYLFTHPGVNDFFNSLEGMTRDQARAKVQEYMAENPQTQAELAGIRAPLTDIKNRCAAPPPPPTP
jgi:hemophore-related protein